MLNVRNQISRGARARGLDPLAVLAVFGTEGLSGRIGDNGHAFGPGQENDAGGVLTGRFPGWSAQQKQRWAMSPAGINDVLNRVAHVAKGKHGDAAINAIVRLFERPANPGAEVQKARGLYGKVGGGPAQAGALAAGQAAPSNTQGVDKMALLQALSAQHPDVGALAGLLAQGHAPEAQAPQRPRSMSRPPAAKGKGAINELFYDPLGGIKHGQQIGAIGGHKDHVHVSLATEAAQKAAIAQARHMGLRVGEESNKDVHPVHAKNSYHYQHYRKGDPLREAADVSGDPHAMAEFYRWVSSTF